MLREIVLGVLFGTIYLFINKIIGGIIFVLLVLWFLINGFLSYLFANKIIKKAQPAAICLGLKQAGHPYYQINLESPGASYIPALKRRPTNSDFFWAIFVSRCLGRIDR
ncbi:MAG: hypothetical protein WCW67_01520, partial [Candidatus Margulisiibacteriota bacterium]|jgi:hypothetical protein